MYLHFSLSLSPSAYFLAYRLIVISFLIFLCFFIILAIFCSLACFFRPQSLSFPSPSPLSINLSGTCGHRSPFTLFSILATPHLAWMFCFCVYRMYLLNNKILFLFSSLALRFALFALFFCVRCCCVVFVLSFSYNRIELAGLIRQRFYEVLSLVIPPCLCILFFSVHFCSQSANSNKNNLRLYAYSIW